MQRELKVTNIVVTHDMQRAFKVGDRLVMLYQGKFIFDGTAEQMQASDDPIIQPSFAAKPERKNWPP